MLIYGNVPRELIGAHRYANSALVDESKDVGESTTPSYFETAKFYQDMNHVHCSIEADGAYEINVEISVDDGLEGSWKTQYVRTQDLPPNFNIEYTSPQMKIRMTVVSADNTVRCILRQG